jgi:UDP:flavonoid glycosyltransferase YjiC (YdhE family)
MRILFSAVPGFGHLLPVFPFVRAAHRQGHQSAVMTSAVMADVVSTELPGVTFLSAGPDPTAIVARVGVNHPGADPVNDPRPETVADFFAGARVDLAYEESLAVARAWGPDLVVVDAADQVGPIVAAALGVPYAVVGFGPELPPEFSAPMVELVASRYAERGLEMQPPIAFVDPAPVSFQAPGWQPTPVTVASRADPYRRDDDQRSATVVPDGERHRARPSVLVTLGTVFNDATLATEIISSLLPLDADVVVTLGVQLSEPPLDAPNVSYATFTPLADLLPGADVVVTAGGAGTVLAAAASGIPMVVLPQGADQFINAERAGAAGVAEVVASPAEVGAAVRRSLDDPARRARAREVAAEIAARPTPDEVLSEVVRRAGA